MAAASPLLAQSPRFTPGASIPVAVAPRGCTTGDFNGDGIPDVAACASLSDEVRIALGDPSGLGPSTPGRVLGDFLPPVGIPVGTIPAAVEAADITGDGAVDLVVVNHDSRDLMVLRGDGAGGFSLGTTVALSGAPIDLILVDFDNDRVRDVAVLTEQPAQVTVLFSDGTGGFSTPLVRAIPGEARNMTCADVNRDLRPDLLVATGSGGSVAILRNFGFRVFAPTQQFVVSTTPDDVFVGDLDNDGNPDLVTLDDVGMITSFLGDGTGAFARVDDFGTLGGGIPRCIDGGDIDLDGNVDVVLSNGNELITFIPGLGNGRFELAEPIPAPAGSSIVDLSVDDIDTDGRPDVLATNRFGWEIIAMMNETPDPTGVRSFVDDAEGTPGCRGFLGFSSNEPNVGQTWLGTVTHTPPASVGLLALGGPLNSAGWDPLGVGAKVHVGPGLVDSLLITSDTDGLASLRLAIPTAPPLQGLVFYLQTIWFERRADGRCSRATGGVVTSRAIEVTVQ